MDYILLYIVVALGISTVLNLFFKRIGVSQIIGYILTGTILVYAFDLRDMNNSSTLEHIGEFGIVFLMFTIGLEISLRKMNSMKIEIFLNGFMQVGFTALVVYTISHYVFSLNSTSALIVSLAFALSSTAVVLSYLKSSKEKKIRIFAGESPFSNKLSIKLPPCPEGIGICTSAGKIGHSLSFGNADAVVVISEDVLLADAVATATGNIVKTKDHIIEGIDFAKNIKGVKGLVIIVDDQIGLWGEIEICK